MAKKKDLLRSKDVANILDLSPDDVIDLVHKRKLTATKVGRIWRFRPEDVMAHKRRQDKQTLKIQE